MRRTLEVSCLVEGVAPAVHSAFGTDPGRWLPEPARWHGRGRWNVRLRAGRLSRLVLCRVGGPWRVGAERWRLLGWMPTAAPRDAFPVARTLPSFSGELGLVERDGRPLLLLRGTYRPPAGPLGAVADAAGLRRVATATGSGFLAAVAARLAGPGAARASEGD